MAELAPGCTEIRGGSFGSLTVIEAGEKVFIYGRSFNLPFGPVTPPPAPPSTPGGLAFAGGVIPEILLDGILQDGTSNTFPLRLRPGAQVVLDLADAPSTAGCGL